MGVVLVLSLLLGSGTSMAASCSISQSGSDSGTVMQGESFVVEVSGLSTSSTVEAQLMLPSSGFSVDEDKTKTKSGVSSISWTTVSATDTKESQSISVSLTVDNVPQGEITCSPDPFDVVTKPNLDVVSMNPSSVSIDSGDNFDVDLNIQNTGETTADLSVSVSGAGTKVSDTLPDEIDPDGNVAGTVTLSADESGTATISVSATNGNTVEREVSVEVQGTDGEDGDDGTDTRTGGGGGGGGGFALPLPDAWKSQDKSWFTIEPGDLVKMQTEEAAKLGVKQVSLSVKNKANNVKITVEKQDGKPADVSVDVSGKAYKYMNIQADNLEDSNVQEANIQFEVNKSWINDNNIDPQKVYLNRYTSGNWEKLETGKVSETDTKIIYESQTPGFSYFAVSGEEVEETVVPVPTETEEEVQECPTCPEPSAWSECVDGTKTRTNYECSAETNYECQSYTEEKACETKEEPAGLPWLPIGIVILLALVAAGGLVYYYKYYQTGSRIEEQTESTQEEQH